MVWCLLSGEFFSEDAIVYFGDAVAEVIDRVGDTIWVSVPPGEPNSIANVLVQNGDGQVGAATFFYGPEPVPEPGAPIVDAIALIMVPPTGEHSFTFTGKNSAMIPKLSSAVHYASIQR